MIGNSLNSSKFIVAWHQSPELRELTAEKAQELLDFEPVWIMLSARLADGVLVIAKDDEAMNVRKLARLAGHLRAELRKLANPEMPEVDDPEKAE